MYEKRIYFNKLPARITLGDSNVPLEPNEQEQARQAAASAARETDWRFVQSALGALDEQLREIECRRKHSLGEMQQAAIELAIAIASRLIHQHIEAGDFAVEQLVEKVLERLDPQQPYRLKMHPDDLQLLAARWGDRPPAWQAFASFEVVADASLQRGECRIDAEDFGILSRIELQLSEIRQHLLECLDDAQIERRRTETADRTLRRFPDRRETA